MGVVRVAPIAACALLALCSCGDNITTGSARVLVDVSDSDVTAVTVTMTGSGTGDVEQALVPDGGSWTGTFTGLAPGSDRVFTAVANDASGSAVEQGSSPPVAITAGRTALVVLELETAPVNHAPQIEFLYASSQMIGPTDAVRLQVTAVDPDGDPLAYAWTGSGTFAAPAAEITDWQPPGDGTFPLTITVTDPSGAYDAAMVAIDVSEQNDDGGADVAATFNAWPEVDDVTLSTGHLAPGAMATATAVAADPDGDALAYTWSDDCGGAWSGTGATALVTMPATITATTCAIRVDVTDGRGGANDGTLTVAVGSDPGVSE